jgi:hypothetical protein
MIKLRQQHLLFDQFTNDAYHFPYWTCTLTNRKGWQRQIDEPQLRGEQHQPSMLGHH